MRQVNPHNYTGASKVLALAIVELQAALLEDGEETPDISPANPLDGVKFASDEAAEAAIDNGLSAEDFDGVEPDGKTGHTKAQVEKIAADARE